MVLEHDVAVGGGRGRTGGGWTRRQCGPRHPDLCEPDVRDMLALSRPCRARRRRLGAGDAARGARARRRRAGSRARRRAARAPRAPSRGCGASSPTRSRGSRGDRTSPTPPPNSRPAFTPERGERERPVTDPTPTTQPLDVRRRSRSRSGEKASRRLAVCRRVVRPMCSRPSSLPINTSHHRERIPSTWWRRSTTFLADDGTPR